MIARGMVRGKKKIGQRFTQPFTYENRAVSSVVEHLVYTERVGGSKPSPPNFLIVIA